MKTEALLRAYGRMVESLNGRYYTACDVGTYVQDMDVIARESDFVTGRSPEHGGAGDSAVLTAYGVFQAMRAAAQHTWGAPSLHGRRIAVEGVGKVGFHLVEHLLEDGASVVVSDVRPEAVERVRAAHPQVEAAEVEALPTSDLDVYAPCALGGSLTDDVVDALKAAVVCGAANNQLAHPGVEAALDARGTLYVPDYLANGGGLIQVGDEALHAHTGGFRFERAKSHAAAIRTTTLAILASAAADGVPPAVAADRLAERRMADVSRLRAILLPR
jgi:valine dehydrogenase (NAD+)